MFVGGWGAGPAGAAAAGVAEGGVGGGAGEVVEVDGGGEHHRALPLHGGQHVRLPREPGAQLGAAPVLLLAAVAAAVLVRVGRLQQPDVLPTKAQIFLSNGNHFLKSIIKYFQRL